MLVCVVSQAGFERAPRGAILAQRLQPQAQYYRAF